jgi:hypothetical protein
VVRLVRRRRFVFGTLALAAAACTRTMPRPTPTPVSAPPEFDRWNEEARNILSDVLETLRTFDVFQAFRVTVVRESSRRLPSELAWDPPTSTAWDEAIHVTSGLRGRAKQLFEAITTTRIDPNLWREQRALADATHDLLDLSDVLGAYRGRVEVMLPGDASGALNLLEKAWTSWDGAAARWGIVRSERISCTSTG